MLDKSKIYVIDNIATPSEANFIEEQFTNNTTAWAYNRSTVDSSIQNVDITFQDNSLNQVCRGGQFVHMVMHGERTGIQSPHARVSQLLMQNMCDKLLFDVDKVIRVKANFNMKQDIRMLDSCYPPHCDAIFENFWTGIYYVNDNDGDTLVFHEKNDIRTPENYKSPESFTILKRVKAKKGRLLLFYGDQYHAGTPPIHSNERIVINFNFTIKE